MAVLKKPGSIANWKSIKGDILHGLPEFCDSVPYQIKSIAIRDACRAISAAKIKYIRTGDISRVKFRSKKDPVQSVYVPSAAIKPQGVFYTMLGTLQYSEQVPAEHGDGRLVCKYGKYYLCVAYESPRHVSENQARVVALDPGVRTFISFFSENSYGKLGEQANLAIQKLCYRLDNLISRSSKKSVRKRKSMKQAEWKLRDRIQCLVDEMHKKVARFLCENFDIIILPTFETQQMSSKARRRIRAKSVRQMLTLSHYKFKMHLKSKAFEMGKMVIDACEAYTSKTVSWTGEIKQIGGSTIIRSDDGRTMDRDINGARGIFLRAVVDTPLLKRFLSINFVQNT